MGTEHLKLDVATDKYGSKTVTLEINVFSLDQIRKKTEQLLNLETDQIEFVDNCNSNGYKLVIKHWDAPWPEEFKTARKLTGEEARAARRAAYREDDRGA